MALKSGIPLTFSIIPVLPYPLTPIPVLREFSTSYIQENYFWIMVTTIIDIDIVSFQIRWQELPVLLPRDHALTDHRGRQSLVQDRTPLRHPRKIILMSIPSAQLYLYKTTCLSTNLLARRTP